MTDPSPPQLTLELPLLSAAGLENFFISGSNASAVALIESWPDWPSAGAVICGPEGSGKSHLADAWRTRSHASRVDGQSISEETNVAFEEAHSILVEDIDRGIADERVLFHVLNLAREKKHSVLLTSSVLPGELDVTLPDLRSRLRALPVAFIAAPDDALIRAVLVKLFADRQLQVEPHVIAHLALHIDRSMAMANRVVAEADRLALARQRRVTRSIAAEALESVQTGR